MIGTLANAVTKILLYSIAIALVAIGAALAVNAIIMRTCG